MNTFQFGKDWNLLNDLFGLYSHWWLFDADFNQLNPVDGTHFSRPWCQRHGTGRVCRVTGHTSSCPPRTLSLPGGVRFIAWRLRRRLLRECRQGPRNLWSYQACLGYGPVPRLTLKKALYYTFPDGGTKDKYRWSFNEISCWFIHTKYIRFANIFCW